MLAFSIETTPDDNGTILVTCPDFPEVTTFGEDESGVLSNAINAIEEAIAARIASGDVIPAPMTLPKGDLVARLPVLTALKVYLYIGAKEQGVTRAELGRRLGWHREQVDRLFRLEHASRLDQMEAAFMAIGQQVDVSILKAA